MDEKFKGFCPHCSQHYTLKCLSQEATVNLPLFLKCGHSVCENCIRNFVKSGKGLECKICERVMELNTNDAATLMQERTLFYKFFPVNVNILGELALELIMEKSEKAVNAPGDCFIDLQAILSRPDQTQGQCLECQSQTTKMCQQCATTICQTCFDKSHKAFVVFKTHILKDIEAQIISNTCITHAGKRLEYFCKDCVKSICLNCLMVGSETSCKSHNVVPLVELNLQLVDYIKEVSPQVDTIFHRLTKTAVDIGHLLQNMDNDKSSTDLEQVTATIEQHFSKLHADIQTHKKEVLGIIARLKAIEKDSLVKAKNDVAQAIKDSYQVAKSLKSALHCEKHELPNVPTLLDDANKILARPWHLTRDESNKNPLKVTVNDDLCMLISDYIHLEGNAKALYKLRATHELDGMDIPPPPVAPVFPPNFLQVPETKDVDATNEELPVPHEVPEHQAESTNNDTKNSNDNLKLLSPEPQKAEVAPVVTFAPNKYSTPLKIGKRELAMITHMNDLDDFYIQRASEETVIIRMEEEMRPHLRPIVKEISIGDMYVVNYNNMWMRCQVQSIDDSEVPSLTYHVTCLDFGYTVPVKIKQLCDAPTRFEVGYSERYPTPIGIRCRLANCTPASGSWTKDDVDFVLHIINNKQVAVEVRSIGALVACDVTTLDGTSIAHALAFHSRAELSQPNLPYPEGKGLLEKPKLYMSNNNLKWKSSANVIITYVESPERFFVREQYLQEDFTKLSYNLNQSYTLTDSAGSIYLPETGLVCVVHVDKEKLIDIGFSGWARAIIKAIIGGGVVCVFLPDVGCCFEVEWTQLRRIKQKFTDLRALASECHLAGPKTEWNKGSTAYLNTFKGHLLKLQVDKKHDRKTVGAILFRDFEGKNICINDEVAAKVLPEADASEDSELPDDINKSVEKLSLAQPSSSTNLTEVASPRNPTMPKQDVKSALRLEVKVIRYDSPSSIYISVIPQQKTFNELFEDIQKFYTKRKTMRRDNWKVNDRCCALCIQSETWRRATIIDIKKDKATVLYTDFASSETVPISNLKKLHSDFEIIGDAAIKCHLAGILPAAGDQWPSLTMEFLKEKLESYKRIFITKMGQFKDKSLPIELWVYHTDQGTALEPDQSEWRCLNKEIIKQGLAVPDETYQAEKVRSDHEMLSLLNLSGSVKDWIQIPQMQDTSLMSSGESSTSSPVKAAYNVATENTLFISDWLPAEPLTATEFTAMPTYIDNDGVIYLHDVSQTEVLDLIRDSLKMGFKEEDPKAQYYNWRVGEPCVARYYLDKSFYRGTVIHVDKDQLKCNIQYVDYGNYEDCSFADLRKGIALHQIPIQAHACSLSRIRPIGGNWELPALDYIHKAIVEKKCFVKVAGEPVDGIIPIDLKYDKLWINDHLVEFDMATYTDGSKPLVRQFIPIKGKVVKAERVLKVDTASEPDYIVEEEHVSSEPSGSPDFFKIRTLTDSHNETYELAESTTFITYPKHEVVEFDCNITVINNTNSLELLIDHGERNALYENLFETIEKESENMPQLDGIFENKACIALFAEDNKWYRATILQYSESKNLVKVRYVDYGNLGIVELQNVREIKEEWAKLPTAAISVSLHGVKINPDIHPDDVTKMYVDTFLDKGPFHVKILHYKKSVPCVELRNARKELVYQEMIDSTVFLPETCDGSN